jgi:uncharacterized protein DUF4386
MESIEHAMPRRVARAAGALWLMCILTGVASYVIGSGTMERNDAVRTAANIMANQSWYRLGLATDVLSAMSYVGVTALLYVLLKPAGRGLSAVAAFFGVCGITTSAVSFLCAVAPLTLLSGAEYLNAFATGQLQAMTLVALKLQNPLFSFGMAFFGIQCAVLGYLVQRSTFLPRALGLLLSAGGTCYVIASFANFVVPAIGGRLSPFVMPIALIGEGALTIRLLASGVDPQRWREQAVRATQYA